MLDMLRDIIMEEFDKEDITITGDTVILTDLGLCSLELIDLIVLIEQRFNIEIPDKAISSIVTVQDLINYIGNDVDSGAFDRQKTNLFNIDDYPLTKTRRHIRKLKRYMRISRLLWRLDVAGLECIPSDNRYIICANHQSYLDCLWVWAAIGVERVNIEKICCLAAEVFLPNKDMLAMFGGIPVDRNGNTIPSMKRALNCINNGYTMFICPEGTRSRDGKIHEFKGGAAKLAIDANVPIIPVRIDGAWDIFPPHRRLPKVFRIGRRYPIKIQFGKPIKPEGKTIDELTGQLFNKILEMGDSEFGNR